MSNVKISHSKTPQKDVICYGSLKHQQQQQQQQQKQQ